PDCDPPALRIAPYSAIFWRARRCRPRTRFQAAAALGRIMNSGQDATAKDETETTVSDSLRLQLEDFLPHRLNVISSLVSLSLTPAGRAVYEELAPRALEFTARLSEVVTAADRVAFDRAVKQLTERSARLVAETERDKTSE